VGRGGGGGGGVGGGGEAGGVGGGGHRPASKGRWGRPDPAGVVALERAPGRRRCGTRRLGGGDAAGAGEVVLDQEHVVGARAVDHGQESVHARDLFALFVEEPAEEALADVVALVACELYQGGDLLGDLLLLCKCECDRLSVVREARPRRLDGRRDRGLVGVEQVLHHHHRVVSLLERLPVEVGGELRQRFCVVVNGDGDVLLR